MRDQPRVSGSHGSSGSWYKEAHARPHLEGRAGIFCTQRGKVGAFEEFLQGGPRRVVSRSLEDFIPPFPFNPSFSSGWGPVGEESTSSFFFWVEKRSLANVALHSLDIHKLYSYSSPPQRFYP